MAPPAAGDEEAVSAIHRTLGIVGAGLVALALWSCFVVVDVTELGWCYGKTLMIRSTIC